MPLPHNGKEIEQPIKQQTLTARYTEQSIRFILAHRNRPFFLYLAHAMPHLPLFRSKKFENPSAAGIYGDVIEELDWSVGEILNERRRDRSETARERRGRAAVVFRASSGPLGITLPARPFQK